MSRLSSLSRPATRLLLVGSAIVLTDPVRPAHAEPTRSEQACFDAVQGKVAWNRKGNTSWSPANVRKLCRGTTAPRARISCFQRQIRQHDEWSRAIEACRAKAPKRSSRTPSKSTAQPTRRATPKRTPPPPPRGRTSSKKPGPGVNAYGEIPTMCWRESYGRGAGTIPTCGRGLQNEAGLCYVPCRKGFTGAAFKCWQDCPKGFRDDGLLCAKPGPYGRGAGYPWMFGDALNLDNAKRRCEKRHRQGCEKSGEIMYPKCRPGFHPVGCCTCSPNCPRGMADMGVSCAKPNGYGRPVGTIPDRCPNGENNAGLCYPKCKRGYNGVGPVCWGNKCPAAFPVECGMSCTTTQAACTEGIFDQVLSPLDMVASITGMAVSGGGTAAASVAARTAVKTVSKSVIKRQLKRVGKNLAEETLDNAASTFYEAQLTGEFSWTDLDPSGIANVVKAYDKPLCKDFE